MIFDYTAACGLLGGLRRGSLKEEMIEKIKRDGSSIKEFLKSYLEEDYPPQEGNEYFERALYISFIKKIGKLLKFLGSEAEEIVKTLLYEFDILNLRLLIRKIELKKEVGAEMFYWGGPYLTFKDKCPSSFKDIDELQHYLRRAPLLRRIFLKSFDDFKFHKEIFYFDIRLDKEYFSLLRKKSFGLERDASQLVDYFITIKLLIYALRLKFFQGRDLREIRINLGSLPLINDKVFSQVLNASSLEEALSVIEKSSSFLKFRAKFPLNFEEGMEGFFYQRFLRRRGINFFSIYPYLSFYLNQRYFIEKMVFIINDRLT